MDFGGLIRSIDWYWLASAVMRVLAVLLCLTVHETCHGLAAYALGDPTARDRHRLSLNPLRHIDWLGLALTALAGPASNFALAFLAMFFCNRVLDGFVTYEGGFSYVLFIFLHLFLAPLSIGLGLFNLLPIPPLDGAKVLGAFLPDRVYCGLMRYERYGMLLLLALSWLGAGRLISGAIQGVYLFFLELCL